MKNIKTAEEILKSRLHFEGETNDKWWLQASVKCFLETGKVSGTLFTEIKTAMEEHTNQFKPEWVSVGFGLPEKDGEYLVRVKLVRTGDICHEVGVFKLRDSEFRTCIENEVQIEITHWTELPQMSNV